MEHEFPCEECGAMVNLDSLVTVKLQEEDGSTCQTQMTEWEARELVGSLAPPVICELHPELGKVVTVAD